MKKSVILCVIFVILFMLNWEQIFLNKICGCGSAVLKFKVVLKFLLKRLLNIDILLQLVSVMERSWIKKYTERICFFPFINQIWVIRWMKH